MKNPNFFEDVYDAVKLIPRGRVTSYGAIASYLGTGMSARMVGWAMCAGHTDKTIPAHRVVNRNGLLTGRFHFETPHAMQEQLEKEKIGVKENKIQNFQQIFWNPTQELL